MEETPDLEGEITEEIAECVNTPLRYVMYSFEWDRGDLAGHKGPEPWQYELLENVGKNIITVEEAIRFAVASGHGVGKTALVSWLILWFMSTRPHCAGVVTANTKNQLTTKTWRELSVWRRRAINGHWFEWSSSKINHVDHPETWFIAATAWTKERPEAFAGLHANDVLVIYDEASAIEDEIWEVSEGAMTTPGAMWFAFGNPTRNTGRFRECFGQFKHRWNLQQVDSRSVSIANQKQIDEWINDYTEDSDFVRVRVKGVFPRAGSEQFISSEAIDIAFTRNSPTIGPKVLGVDIARFGGDQTCVLRRHGNRLIGYDTYMETSIPECARIVGNAIEEWHPDLVLVDGAGVGGGVVDMLHEAGHRVIEVNGGHNPDEIDRYYNHRAEMWANMREWINKRACLGPYDEVLKQELISVTYGFDNKNRIQLETKKDMRRRGVKSPDIGDALALSFAMKVPTVMKPRTGGPRRTQAGDCDLFDLHAV